jgi:DNA-directed RNA polymerase specialized sigma24 family protein
VRADPEFQQLYRSERQAVFSTVYLLCRNRVLAEDATQEAFSRALERWGRLRGRPWVGGWVTSTALNVARRALRKRPGIGPPGGEADPDTSISLWMAVRGLPLRQQQAVVLHYRLDIPVEEVAGLMALSPGTVRTHLARARQALRRSLEGEPDAGGREHSVHP